MQYRIKIQLVFLLFTSLTFIASCQHKPDPKVFSKEALANVCFSTSGDSITLGEIIDQHKGSIILIDVWASWCHDCAVGLPKIKALKEDYPDVVYLYLSVDKEDDKWVVGNKQFGLDANTSYRIKGAWKKSEIGSFLDLDWIPRYLVVDKKGNISLFKAIKTDDPKLLKALH